MNNNPYVMLLNNTLPSSGIFMLVATLILGVLSSAVIVSFVKERIGHKPSTEDIGYVHPATGVLIILGAAIGAIIISLASFLPWHIYLIVEFVFIMWVPGLTY